MVPNTEQLDYGGLRPLSGGNRRRRRPVYCRKGGFIHGHTTSASLRALDKSERIQKCSSSVTTVALSQSSGIDSGKQKVLFKRQQLQDKYSTSAESEGLSFLQLLCMEDLAEEYNRNHHWTEDFADNNVGMGCNRKHRQDISGEIPVAEIRDHTGGWPASGRVPWHSELARETPREGPGCVDTRHTTDQLAVLQLRDLREGQGRFRLEWEIRGGTLVFFRKSAHSCASKRTTG